MSVHNSPLDIVEVCVVLECALEQAGLLEEGGDVGPVVVAEHLVVHDGVGHLWRGHQVHLQQPRLQRTLAKP